MQKILLSCMFATYILSCRAGNVEETLNKYRSYMDYWTLDGQDWSSFKTIPLSRYHTFLIAFKNFEKHHGKTVVELGTSRSFTHGGHDGCNSSDTRHWDLNKPENWDWGAGFFTRMAAECLQHMNPIIHTIDIEREHINRCKVMTADFKDLITYHVCSSLDFLRQSAPESIDLLYVDTGDMTPIEPTAQLQLAEAKIIVERNLLSKNGLILIDDVRNQTPKKFGETSDLGKAKYSIAYFLENGYEVVANEYQVILKRKN